MHPSRLPDWGPKPIQAPHRREPRIGAFAGAKGLPGSAFAPPEYPYTRSFSNRTPVLSSLSGHEVNDLAQAAVGPRRCPPTAEATGSNPVGRAGRDSNSYAEAVSLPNQLRHKFDHSKRTLAPGLSSAEDRFWLFAPVHRANFERQVEWAPWAGQ